MAPENTLAAFDLALQQGADGIELDTQLCADGVPVVMHDDWLERTTGTPGSVFNSTLAELKRLDAGSWFEARFAGERIPTLGEVLDLCRNRGTVNIEIKSGHGPVPGLVDAVLKVVHTWTTPDQVLISSFDPRVVRRVRRRAPALATAFLRSYEQPFPPLSLLSWAVGAHYLDVDPPLSAGAARLVGWERVLCWTVDQETEVQRLGAEGIGGIITNWPARTKAILESLRARRSGVMP
jgi:glycerophosphoryl diester phosphodiesterase